MKNRIKKPEPEVSYADVLAFVKAKRQEIIAAGETPSNCEVEITEPQFAAMLRKLTFPTLVTPEAATILRKNGIPFLWGFKKVKVAK